MKKIQEFVGGISKTTSIIVYIGMFLAIISLIIGSIIYYSYENFNTNFSNFILGEQLISSGYAFILCTLITAALSEYIMRQIHKKDN